MTTTEHRRLVRPERHQKMRTTAAGEYRQVNSEAFRATGSVSEAGSCTARAECVETRIVLRNYSHRVKFSRYSHHRLADARRRRIFMMQSTQYRLREHSDTIPQSMAGFGPACPDEFWNNTGTWWDSSVEIGSQQPTRSHTRRLIACSSRSYAMLSMTNHLT
jgi:hypothetical protein